MKIDIPTILGIVLIIVLVLILFNGLPFGLGRKPVGTPPVVVTRPARVRPTRTYYYPYHYWGGGFVLVIIVIVLILLLKG